MIKVLNSRGIILQAEVVDTQRHVSAFERARYIEVV